MPAQTVVVGTSENWSKEVEGSSLPVLVDFWAAWCGPCRLVSPIIDQLAKKYDGKVKVVKLNVDEYQELAMKFGIMSIPTVILFERGIPKATRIGSGSAEDFESMLVSISSI